jgi:hypothetical protein
MAYANTDLVTGRKATRKTGSELGRKLDTAMKQRN